ncbi:MAG: hypothetical protein HQL19_07750 [Candidatus Omnitrophica bacterium]|nr:hypothetical protein [Candidatus Omnitrophota bacterium]
MPSERELVKGYQELLDSFQWDVFVTITFRKRATTAWAIHAVKCFLKHLNSREVQFFKKFVRCFVFSEKYGQREGIHLHLLIQGIDPSMAGALERKCLNIFGESAVKPYDHSLPRLASFYLAEKCISPLLDHWDFFKINSRLRVAI